MQDLRRAVKLAANAVADEVRANAEPFAGSMALNCRTNGAVAAWRGVGMDGLAGREMASKMRGQSHKNTGFPLAPSYAIAAKYLTPLPS